VSKFLITILLATLWFAGCSKQPVPANKPQSTNLEGVTWQLMNFGTHALKVPQKAWIKLEHGRYTGFAGCNGLSGTYQKEGMKIHFTMDPHTMKVCPDLQGENKFRKSLLDVDRYRIDRDGLLVFLKQDKTLLMFMREQ
jgi:putative lipoprotein